MIFWSKKRSENENETLEERFSRLEKRFTRLEAEILDIATAQDIIRNKVLRKIQSKKEEVEEESETETFKGIPKAKSFNNKIGINS